MSIRPLQDRRVVERLEEEEKGLGGMIIPDKAEEKRNVHIGVSVIAIIDGVDSKWKGTEKK